MRVNRHLQFLKIKFFNNVKFLILPAALFLVVLYSSGCGNSVTGTEGGSVTYTMNQQPGTTGIQFIGKPSVDVKITKVVCNLPSQNPPLSDTIVPNNPNYVYSKDSFYVVNEYSGVTAGQKWNFVFTGTIVAGGASYTSTANYTAQ